MRDNNLRIRSVLRRSDGAVESGLRQIWNSANESWLRPRRHGKPASLQPLPDRRRKRRRIRSTQGATVLRVAADVGAARYWEHRFRRRHRIRRIGVENAGAAGETGTAWATVTALSRHSAKQACFPEAVIQS